MKKFNSEKHCIKELLKLGRNAAPESILSQGKFKLSVEQSSGQIPVSYQIPFSLMSNPLIMGSHTKGARVSFNSFQELGFFLKNLSEPVLMVPISLPSCWQDII